MISPTDTQAIDRAVAELRYGKENVRYTSSEVTVLVFDDDDVDRHRVPSFFNYSPATNIAQAWELVEEMEKLGHGISLDKLGCIDDDWDCTFFVSRPGRITSTTHSADAPTPQVAICLAYIAFKKEQA